MFLACVGMNFGKHSGKNIGVFVNDECKMETKETQFTFIANPGDKVVIKVSGLFGGSVVAERTLLTSAQMGDDETIFTIG
jgi:hypothetical protein